MIDTPADKTSLPPGSQDVHDMSPAEFRQYGHQVVDWIASYLADIDSYPVLSQVRPGDISAQLPGDHPDVPESMERILADIDRVIMPGITHWNHPSFFSYFSISASGPGILGELLTAALNVNGMLWKTSPAVTEVEETTLDWLRQMLGLPPVFRGIIMDTASMGVLSAIAAAREALALDIRQKGMAGRPDLPRLRLYASEQAHSSVEKAALTLGIGQEGLRKISTDAEFRMVPQALDDAIADDSANGWRPFCVVATVGTTSTTSIDPVPEIAAVCKRWGLWLHVDGAYGGVAAVSPRYRHVLTGCADADSIVVNPHKWLFTPIDCSALYVRDPQLLKSAFSLVPEYLKTSDGEVNNYMDWGVQLGRRFRALKLWMVLRYFGHDGLARRIDYHIQLAHQFAAWVDSAAHFECTAPAPFSTVCFRAHPQGVNDEHILEQINARLLEAVNSTGEMYISHTKLGSIYTLRFAIGNIRTAERHVARAWEILTTQLEAIMHK